ncbi:MAG: hypothetical protein LBI53_08215 [Candidatus Peribacteria bacterium]|jgi:hypothetical protein|nr:hypothetical protein [Candidatus Peribacteria bacterium]
MIHEYGLKIPEGHITPNNLGPNSEIDPKTILPPDLADLNQGNRAQEIMKSMKNNPSALFDKLGPDMFNMNTISEVFLEQLLKYQTLTLSTPLQNPDPKNEYVFIPISYLESSDGIQVYKEYRDINGGILQKGDKVNVKVTIKASKNFRGTFGDKIQGPRVVSYSGGVPNLSGINQSTTKILLEKDNDFTYFLDNIQLTTGQILEYGYTLTYTEASTQSITLEDINGETYDKDTPSIKAIKADGLLDIKLQPQGGCIKYMKTLINTNNSKEKNREYTMVDINLQKLIDEYTKDAEEQQRESTKELSKITDIAKPGSNRHETMEDLPGISTSNVNIRDAL